MFFYKKITPELSVNLDFIRFTAASLVMLGHFRGDYFVKYVDLLPQYKNVINYGLYFLTQLGGEAVVVFFVLSGFLVGGANVSNYQSKTFSFKKNFIDRLSRMWVVLVPTMLFSIVLCTLSYHLTNDASFIDSISIDIFLGNLFFLQNILTPVYGLNAPLWSLSNEFWYYILWAIFLLALQKRNLSTVTIAVFVFIVGILFLPNILLLFPLWILGVLIRFIPSFKILKSSVTVIISVFIFLASLAVSSLLRDDKYLMPTSYMVGICFALMLLLLQHSNKSIFPFIIAKPKVWAFLASFSFSLYAFHFVFQKFLYEWLKTYVKIPMRIHDANFSYWMLFVSIILVVYVFAYLFYLISEKQTIRVRRAIYKLLNIE